MRMVAPIWRAAALAMPLAVAVGCDWIPVRRRLDPSLYPVPVRADATYLQGDRDRGGPGPDEASRRVDRPAADRPADRRALPPLPALTRVTPEEALAPPAPTPLLDAALVRANAVRSAAFEPGDGRPDDGTIGPVGDEVATEAESVTSTATGDPGPPGPPDPGRGPESSPVDLPPMAPGPIQAEPVEPDAESPAPEPIDLPPLEPVDAGPLPAGSAGTSSGEGPEGGSDATIETPSDDHWRAGLENLLALAEEEEAQGGGSAEVWAARKRVLDWVAEAEGEVDDATLWQTVMVMLSESDPAPAPIEVREVAATPADDREAGTPGLDGEPTLRVSRVAFCQEVFGFGRIDPIDPGACRAGQDVIVYCELEGVRYEAEGDAQAARLWTALEIVPEEGGPSLWREVHPLEDRCARPRRDFFVGYGLTLPASLSPGRYRFRVEQDDLGSGAEAAGELPFEIVQGAG